MGYSANAALEDLFDVGPAERAAQRMTKRSGEALTDGAARRTPVAAVPAGLTPDQFAGGRGRAPGTMKKSWRTGSVEESRNLAGEERFGIDSYTEDPQAPHVEYPTRPHIIRPSPARAPASVAHTGKPRRLGTDPAARLRYWVGGREVFAAEVHHPGTQGVHMMRDSLTEVEATWVERVGAEEIERWAREQARLVS
jgi:hypothetical protein